MCNSFLCWSEPPRRRLEDVTIAGFHFSILEGPFNEKALPHRCPSPLSQSGVREIRIWPRGTNHINKILGFDSSNK